MIYKGVIRGSVDQAIPVIIGSDTVYIHKNMKKVEEVDEHGNPREDYEYEETQYTFAEYIQLQMEENRNLAEQLENAQLATLELYENMG